MEDLQPKPIVRQTTCNDLSAVLRRAHQRSTKLQMQKLEEDTSTANSCFSERVTKTFNIKKVLDEFVKKVHKMDTFCFAVTCLVW